MPKNIILCSDGTGNSDIKGRGTNVFKLFEAIDLIEHRTDPNRDTQLAFYDDGVGTRGNALVRWIGGAAGYGLKRNVKELYRELSRVYDEGDRIFLFGFSRGAFTARTLSGMIGACGVLHGDRFDRAQALRDAVEEAYNAYRAKYHSVVTTAVGQLLRWPAAGEALNAFKEKYKDRLNPDVQIDFIGVWDTVDAVGMPFAIADTVNALIYQFKFKTKTLSTNVRKACHALSIDDPRLAFEPVLWSADPRIDQVWFAGVHSNVGGGYPKQGMSLVALDWMLAHAQRAGLRLQTLDRDLFRGHASVDDLMYNPRAGLGLFYRWGPRDIAAYCRECGIEPHIHLSVAERIAHATDDYAPGNIPPQAKVVITPVDEDDPDRAFKEGLLEQRAAGIGAAITKAFDGRYLLDGVKSAVQLGQTSYSLFLAGWIAVGVAIVTALASINQPGDSRFAIAGGALIAAAAEFAFAWLLARRAAHVMEDEFSSFWQKHQRTLRDALKQTKKDSKRRMVEEAELRV